MTRWLLLLCLVAVAPACSALIEPSGTGLRCAEPEDDDEPDPCPSGQRCVDGRCEDDEDASKDAGADGDADADADGDADAADAGEDGCVRSLPSGMKEEDVTSCDNEDNDCNGKVDEGADLDGDGYAWCTGHSPDEGDCAENDSDSYPGAAEVCDNVDNDCDGKVDEDPEECDEEGEACIGGRCVVPSCLYPGSGVECEDGERCTEEGECVRGEGCSLESCSENQRCDTDTGFCVTTGRPNGDPCTADDECASRMCIDGRAVRIRSDVAARVCARSCCSDADCGSDEFCFASGSGARSCLPRSTDPRESAPAACATSSACTDGSQCVLAEVSGFDSDRFWSRRGTLATVCAEPNGSDVEVGDHQCNRFDRCETGICEMVTLLQTVCSVSCGRTEDCAQALDPDGDTNYYCRTKQPRWLDSDDAIDDYVSVCVWRPGGESREQGEECDTSSQCRDGACVASEGSDQGTCADACCKDSHCPEGARCRPVPFGRHYEMRCVP